jgi:hypothetical protein
LYRDIYGFSGGLAGSLKTSVQIKPSGYNLLMPNTQTLAAKFVLEPEDAEELLLWIEGKVEIIEDELFEKLYSFYCLNGEMPYGVAKCRTADPYQWIHDKLCEEFQV